VKKLALSFILLAAAFTLVSCQIVITSPTVPPEEEDNGQDAAIELLLTDQAATIESLNTLVAETPAPIPTETEIIPEATDIIPEATEVPLYSGEFGVIESGGLTFKLPVEVAQTAAVSVVQADDPNQGWPEFSLPERRMASFLGYSIQNHFHTPVIYVYPLLGLYQGGQIGAATAARLQALLNDPAFDLQTEDDLPFLPPFNAAQVIHVLEQRLESEHNSGIRYLTLYSQAFVGVDNYNTFYTYQGISADGRYYIAAILPINSSLLSDQELTQTELETLSADFPAYLTSMTDLIRADGGASMTPTLAALDAMMMSLTIQD
jgi:hypothetical protein